MNPVENNALIQMRLLHNKKVNLLRQLKRMMKVITVCVWLPELTG